MLYFCPECKKECKTPYCTKCGTKCTEKKEEYKGSSNYKVSEEKKHTETKKDKETVKNNTLLRNLLISVSIAIIIMVAGVFGFRMYISNLEDEVNTAVNLAEESFNEKNYEMALNQLADVKDNRYYEQNEKALLIEGKSLMELKNYEDAASCFEKALFISDNDEAVLNLAVCYAREGKSEKALDVIENTKQKTDVKKYIEGEIYLKEKDDDKAEQKFREVIDNTDDEGLKRNSYIQLATLYREKRHEDKENFTYLNKQIEIMEEAVKVLHAEDDIVLTEMMAEAYYTAMYYDLSLNKFNRLLELGYERPYIYVNIAVIHQQIGNYDEAEETLIDMRSKFPEDYSCYLHLGLLYIDIEGEKAQENRDYSKVVKNYELAQKYVDDSHESELIPLENAIEELEDKGWLD